MRSCAFSAAQRVRGTETMWGLINSVAFVSAQQTCYFTWLMCAAFLILSSPRTHLRSIPHCGIDIYCLHHRGLSGSGLLLHVFKTQTTVAADPVFSAELSDRDSAHDPGLDKLQDAVEAVQYCDKFQFDRRLGSPLLLSPSGARLPRGITTSTVHIWLLPGSPCGPPDPAVGISGVAAVLWVPSPARACPGWEKLL